MNVNAEPAIFSLPSSPSYGIFITHEILESENQSQRAYAFRLQHTDTSIYKVQNRCWNLIPY